MMGSNTADQATLPEPEVLCCDALAELFLGETGRPGAEPQANGMAFGHSEPAPVESSEPSPARATTADVEPGCAIEAVLAGHLPVMASAWVSQYARGVAAKAGLVGLIRAGEGRLSVEVFGDGAPRPEQAPTCALEAVRRLRPSVRRWLIQADSAFAGAMIDRGEVDRLTLLCSADEAALVAGYRMVKDLLEPRLELAAPMGALHIAIAGRADPEAMAAAERLSRAAEQFLGIETTVAVGAARVETGVSASWFDGAGPESVAELAAAIGAEDSGAADGPEAWNNGDVWPAIFGPVFEGSFEPAAAAGEIFAHAITPAAPAEPTPAPATAPDAIEALSLQCPRAPAIQFRLEDGHLVAIADARAQGMDLAIRQLVIAGAWAAEHDALIALATGHSGRLAQRVLLVEDAAAARHLLDADIRVRVAAAGRCEIPLN
jgi:hypothetical protein